MRVSLSLSKAGGRGLMIALGLSGVLLGVVLAAISTNALRGQAIPVEVLDAMAMSTGSALCLTAGLVATVVNLVSPRESSLATLLDLLPVPRSVAALGAHLPMMAVGAAGGLVLATPTLWLAWRSTRDVMMVSLLVASIVVSVTAINVLVCTLFAAVRRIAERWLRLPQHLAIAVAGGTSIAASLGAFGPTVLTDGLRPDAQVNFALWSTPQGLLAAVIRGSWGVRLSAFAGLIILLVLAATAFVVHFAGRLERAAQPARRLRVLRGFPTPTPRLGGLVFLNMLPLVRAPQFLVTILLVPVGAFAASAATSFGVPAEISAALAGILLVSGMVLVGQSTGVTLPYTWVVKASAGTDRQWVWARAIAASHVHVVIAVYGAIVITLAGVPLDQGWGATWGAVGIAWASALLGGAIAPYDDRHSLSPGVTLAVSAVLYSLASLVLGVLHLDGGAAEAVVATVMSALYFLAYLTVCRRLNFREPARA